MADGMEEVVAKGNTTSHRIAANHNALVIFLQAINDRHLQGTRRRLSRRWQACNMYWMRLRRAVTLVPLSRLSALCGRRWQAIKRRFQSFSGKGPVTTAAVNRIRSRRRPCLSRADCKRRPGSPFHLSGNLYQLFRCGLAVWSNMPPRQERVGGTASSRNQRLATHLMSSLIAAAARMALPCLCGPWVVRIPASGCLPWSWGVCVG